MERIMIFATLIALLMAACGGDDDATEAASTADGDWVMASGSLDGAEVPVVDGYRITMSIAGGDIGGTAACNSYGGTVERDETTFRVVEFSVTEMACEPPVMASEAAFLEALGRLDSYERGTDALTLRGEGVELVFTSLAPVPTADLVDTVWILESLVEGNSVSTVMGDATLELRDDGTLTGSTGCRELTGTWVTAGDTVQFTEFAALGDCDPELASQDEHVTTVLGDGFTATIEGDRLLVRSAGLEGLDYRADR
jgi:heat shock protein HslJ